MVWNSSRKWCAAVGEYRLFRKYWPVRWQKGLCSVPESDLNLQSHICFGGSKKLVKIKGQSHMNVSQWASTGDCLTEVKKENWRKCDWKYCSLCVTLTCHCLLGRVTRCGTSNQGHLWNVVRMFFDADASLISQRRWSAVSANTRLKRSWWSVKVCDSPSCTRMR